MVNGERIDDSDKHSPNSESQKDSEKRGETRVSVGRPGTFLVDTTRDGLRLSCGVIDISEGGCRIMLPRAGLGHTHEWTPNMPGRVRVALQPNREITLEGNIVWSKAMGSDAEIIAFRFPSLSDDVVREVRAFVAVRVRADVEVPMPAATSQQADEGFVAVATKIRFFAQLSPHLHEYPWRYAITEMSNTRLRARYAPNKGEELPPPELDAVLSLTYSPPSYEAKNKGVIRFTARVVEFDGDQIELALTNTSGEVMASIRSLTTVIDNADESGSRMVVVVAMVGIALLLILLIYFFS